MKKRLLKGSLVMAIAVIASAIIFFALSATNVIKANPFKLGFAIISFGIGGIFTVYGLATKGGYEIGIGLMMFLAGAVALMIGALEWWLILIIVIGVLVISVMVLLLAKSNSLVIERTDEKADFKPYSEVLEEKKRADAVKDAEPLPELKDYSDED